MRDFDRMRRQNQFHYCRSDSKATLVAVEFDVPKLDSDSGHFYKMNINDRK